MIIKFTQIKSNAANEPKIKGKEQIDKIVDSLDEHLTICSGCRCKYNEDQLKYWQAQTALYFEKVAALIKSAEFNTSYVNELITEINKSLVNVYMEVESIEEEEDAS